MAVCRRNRDNLGNFQQKQIFALSKSVDLLQKNLDLNNIQSRVFPSAIAVTDGFLEMELDAKDYGHKVAGIEYGKKLTGKTIQVEALSIPT